MMQARLVDSFLRPHQKYGSFRWGKPVILSWTLQARRALGTSNATRWGRWQRSRRECAFHTFGRKRHRELGQQSVSIPTCSKTKRVLPFKQNGCVADDSPACTATRGTEALNTVTFVKLQTSMQPHSLRQAAKDSRAEPRLRFWGLIGCIGLGWALLNLELIYLSIIYNL